MNFENEKFMQVTTDIDLNAITVGTTEEKWLPTPTESLLQRQERLLARRSMTEADIAMVNPEDLF
jgi:hypothetical protein